MFYFSIEELCRSSVAASNHILNTPDFVATQNLKNLVDNILDPLREAFGQPILVNSAYRSVNLNALVGGASNSQHLYGQAADITAKNQADNAWLFHYIEKHLPFDQLIWEKGTSKFPAWIHVSYVPFSRHQILHIP